MNCDFGGTAPTFLYQHFRPSISRQDHQPDPERFGALKHSIARADELATQQQRSRVTPSGFMTGKVIEFFPGVQRTAVSRTHRLPVARRRRQSVPTMAAGARGAPKSAGKKCL